MKINFCQQYSQLTHSTNGNYVWAFTGTNGIYNTTHCFSSRASFKQDGAVLLGTEEKIKEELDKAIKEQPELRASVEQFDEVIVHAEKEGDQTTFTFSTWYPGVTIDSQTNEIDWYKIK